MFKPKFRIYFAVLLLTFLAVGTCFAHKPGESPHQLYYMGDFALENGTVIKDFSISFVTQGVLNNNKSNAILMTASYMGNHHRVDFLIGPGKAFDTNKYFIICTDAIGNGLTTSPSNSITQHGMAFPRFSVRDMVKSQYELLTKYFGIKHLVAVTGASMGGMQTLQWGVSYPNFMDNLIPLTPSTRCPAWSAGIFDVVVKTIMLDPAWYNGNYTTNPQQATRLRTDLVLSLFASTPEAVTVTYQDDPQQFLSAMKTLEDSQLGFDANNSIYQAWAIMDHNIADTPGFNGDYYKALKSIKAKTLMLIAPLDLLVPNNEAKEASRYIPCADYVEIPSVQGHFAASAKDPQDVEFMNQAITKFLKKYHKHHDH